MAKLLIQCRASPRDPDYAEAIRLPDGEERIAFHAYFAQSGAQTLQRDEINSCHKNPRYIRKFEPQIAQLVKDGHQVVLYETGGLNIAKPSIDAAHLPTVPILCVPLKGPDYGGLDAFTAGNIPDCTAVVGWVGLERHDTAAHAARAMFTHEFDGVYLLGGNKKLEEKLGYYGIPVKGDATNASDEDLVVGVLDWKLGGVESIDRYGVMSIFTVINKGEESDLPAFHEICQKLWQSVYVRGEKNVATYAAKILALHNPDIAKKLEDEAAQLAADLEKLHQDITYPESFREV